MADVWQGSPIDEESKYILLKTENNEESKNFLHQEEFESSDRYQ